ncbi:hypothetical protein FA13DRAFT_1744348 [Coprinellus micaceus]|uniref:Uncharacterized protein n=1 Tax=Coprinellus micaceus TaxID=71717 RepID=A0A4Y7SCW2_COPMI|nr:hypothetical protein FA13DRAFT_1744348 [Coprinellus micaceus]
MAKKSKREKAMEEKEHVETQYFRLQPWVKGWAEAITAPPGGVAYRRLCQLLSGPEPVNGVPSRPPCLDAESLFADFVEYLDLPDTPQAMESLDDFLSAIFTYSREKKIDMKPLINPWAERQFLGPPGDFGDPGNIDMGYIISSLFLARMFALELGYVSFGWTNLRQGLGLRLGDEWVSESTLIGSCAQLLGGGHRIRKWCTGIGLEGRPDYFDGWLEKPSKKRDFQEVLAAVEVWYEKTENEWTKAVLLATKEHFQFGFRDLTSKEVYEIIFEKTKPGTASGDEATAVEQAENDGAGE